MLPAEEFRYLVLALQREGNRQLSDALRPLGITPSQAEVIQVLAQYQPMTLLQLGERLVCEGGSPSRLVGTMVEAGWLEKHPNPDDGRAVLLRLTSKGEAILPALMDIEGRFNAAIGTLAEPHEFEALIAGLWPLARASQPGQALLRRKHNS